MVSSWKSFYQKERSSQIFDGSLYLHTFLFYFEIIASPNKVSNEKAIEMLIHF